MPDDKYSKNQWLEEKIATTVRDRARLEKIV